MAYDFWWHLGYDVAITSEWGTPNMVENGVNPTCCWRQVRPLDPYLGPPKRRHLKTLDLGAEQQMVLELRPAHDPTKPMGSSAWWYRPRICRRRYGCGIGTKGEWKIRKVIEVPAEPADPALLPPALKPFKAVPPLITDINLSLDDKYLYISCFGTGEFQQYDVSDPFNPS